MNVFFFFKKKKEKKNLIDELEITKNQNAEYNNELIHLQELVERLQADKTKLSRRVSKLVHNGNSNKKKKIFYIMILFLYKEKDLLQELQKSRRTTKAPTPTVSTGLSSKKHPFSTRLDIHFKNLEDERDMYKNEVEILQKLLNERFRGVSSTSPSRLRGRSLSPTAATRLAAKRDIATSPVMQSVKRSASSGNTSPTRCTVCGLNRNRLSSPTRVKEKYFLFKKKKRNFLFIYLIFKDMNSYETQLRNLEEERDRFRRELHKYKRSSKEKVDFFIKKIF
jgi:hypothetical protein